MHPRVIVSRNDHTRSFAMDDRIFLGEGLFESIRVEKAKPCFAQMHWQRLSDSAQKLGIPFDLSPDDWYSCLIDEIKNDNLYQGGIKAILSGGSAPRGLAEQGQISHLIFQTFNYTVLHKPLRLMRAPWCRDASNPLYQLKSINYLEAIFAKRQAIKNGFDDALFFNMQGNVTETTTANFFVIIDGKIITPPLADGAMFGVTRERLFTLCQQLQVVCNEQSISIALLERADAAFVTNAMQGLLAVATIEEASFNPEHALIEELKELIFRE